MEVVTECLHKNLICSEVGDLAKSKAIVEVALNLFRSDELLLNLALLDGSSPVDPGFLLLLFSLSNKVVKG